jgi:hypothetical protein
MTAGTTVNAKVVIDNHTGHALTATGCLSLFQIVLRNANVHPQILWPLCAQRFVIPIGTSSHPVKISVTYLQCSDTGRPQGTIPACEHGPPPLPPGDYQAVLFQNDTVAPTPPPIPVHVVARTTTPVPTTHPAATAPVFVESAVVAGAPGGLPPCASGVTGDYWGDAAHPERAPLRRDATFSRGHRWALCGASVAFSMELLNLRSNNGGATWNVSVTPMAFAPHHAGDDLKIALTSETAGRVTFTSLVAPSSNATFETHDGGRTWIKI